MAGAAGDAVDSSHEFKGHIMNLFFLRNATLACALTSGCILAAQTPAPAPAAPIRVAVYEDEGSETAATFFDQTVGIDKAHF